MEHQRDPPARRRLIQRCNGQDGVETLEIALIGALVMIAILVAFPLLFDGIGSAFNNVTTAIQDAAEGTE